MLVSCADVKFNYQKPQFHYFSCKVSPNISNLSCDLNLSNQSKYLMPEGNGSRNFSPFNAKNTPRTPNLSPIVKPKTPASESAFLKRRDFK